MTVNADRVRYFFRYLGVRQQRARVSQPEYSPAERRLFHWENVHSMHKGNREASDVRRLDLHDIWPKAVTYGIDSVTATTYISVLI